MKVFRPPYRVDAFPRFHPKENRATQRFRSHYRSEPVGVSVWVLNDGTVTTTNPGDNYAVWYRGGYVYDITDDAAAVLIAAGYSVSDPPTTVPDTTGPIPIPRPPYPRTWAELGVYTWEEATQFLWGGFPGYGGTIEDTTGGPQTTPHPQLPSTWQDLSEMTWSEASQFLWGSFENHV